MRELTPADVAARAAISATLRNYARGVDRRDWDLVRSCYHHDAVDDHGVYRGGIDGFIEYFRAAANAWDLTSHYVFEPDIVLAGDSATVDSQVVAHHVSGETDMVMGARYEDAFECRDGDWRVLRRTVVVEWLHLGANDLPRWQYADRFTLASSRHTER